MKVIVSSAYDIGGLSGNAHSVLRIAAILREAGLDATASKLWHGEKADALIALHAKKSGTTLRHFIEANPGKKAILYLTGTDLYRDIPAGDLLSMHSLERADHLVVAHEAALNTVPEEFHHKTHVVHTSVDLPELKELDLPRRPFASTIGHLRSVKAPLLAASALGKLPNLNLRVFNIGSSYDPVLTERARLLEHRDSRYQYLGAFEPAETLRWTKESLFTLNTSMMEGGANAVIESIMLDTPMIASKIEGNIGLLGEDYAGYFPSGDISALAALMHKTATSANFRELLTTQIRARKPRFTRDRERSDWLDILYHPPR